MLTVFRDISFGLSKLKVFGNGFFDNVSHPYIQG
jgi:hypothetical protein